MIGLRDALPILTTVKGLLAGIEESVLQGKLDLAAAQVEDAKYFMERFEERLINHVRNPTDGDS